MGLIQPMLNLGLIWNKACAGWSTAEGESAQILGAQVGTGWRMDGWMSDG